MRTRCSNCATVFRVTPEQLRIRSGMVRCGHCLAVFNAFDHLVEEKADAAVEASLADLATHQPLTTTDEPTSLCSAPDEEVVTAPAEEAPATVASETSAFSPLADDEVLPATEEDVTTDSTVTTLDPETTDAEQEAPPAAVAAAEAENATESPEDSTRAAREAGLVAIRDMTDSLMYDRWAAGTLASGLSHGIEVPAGRGARLFAILGLLLALLLAGQAAYYFRSALSQQFPALRAAYSALAIEVPLPREADLVSIESSDLQADASRGLLVLQATLKNRASFAQDWPLIELTLTDLDDNVLLRRVLNAADYLPASSPTAFAAQSETGLKLWLQSPQPAAGYRLYVFYP